MKLNLKSGASSSKEIEIDESSNVKELRQKVAEAFNTEVTQVVLIFAGKIIKDEQSLSENKVSDGKAVHVVIKKGATSAAPAQSAPTRAPVSNTPAAPIAAPATNNANPLAGGIPNIPGMQGLGGMSGGNMQDMQNQMMQNPEMMSRLMDNPMVQSLMSDPAVINEMMNSNPQMRQIMEQNPEVGAVMRDPENLRRAMSMMRNPAAMQEMMRNQDQALRNVESMPGGSAALGRMFNDVLNPMQDAMGGQNPYQAAAASDSNNANNTGSSETAPNPWAANTNTSTNNAEANTTNTAGNQGLPQMSQGLQDAMRNHMMQNPQLLTSMFGERMNMATDNPEVANRVTSLLTNPSLINSMQKPEVRAALTKIQEGFAVINREAPELARAMGMPDMGAFGGNMFTGGSSANAAAATPSVPPEERFKDQLDQLAAMGFADRARSIQALQACGGNVQMAVNWLLEN